MTSFKGSVTNISVIDPDIYGATYGTVKLTIDSVKRPNAGNAVVNMTNFPIFYISDDQFFADNSASSYLSYDVNLCSNISACIDYFNADLDGLFYTVYKIVILATDGGGLSASLTLSVNVTQVVPTPEWLSLPVS